MNKFKFPKKKVTLIVGILILIYQVIFNPNFSLDNYLNKNRNNPSPTISNQDSINKFVKVSRVIDGDTIELETGQKVRYIGINAPEIYLDTNGKKTLDQCFANEAYLENKKLVEDKTVRLEKDTTDTDKYGRLLRYVYIDDIFINEYLIKNGFAKIMTVKPNVKYYQFFKEIEKNAKENKLGLWSTCLPQ